MSGCSHTSDHPLTFDHPLMSNCPLTSNRPITYNWPLMSDHPLMSDCLKIYAFTFLLQKKSLKIFLLSVRHLSVFAVCYSLLV